MTSIDFTKNNKPLVSVILPTWNSSRFLEQSIGSILAQTYAPIEIIVVDDGSTDDSKIILNKYADKIVFLSQDHNGPWSARNLAVKNSKGLFLAFQDADDISLEDRLSKQIEVFEKNSDIGIVFGMMQEFENINGDSVIRPGRENLDGCCPGTMLVKKDTFIRIGEFSTKWELAGFLDWFQRSKNLGIKSHTIDSVILKRRIHEANSGAGKQDVLTKEYAEVIRENIARRKS